MSVEEQVPTVRVEHLTKRFPRVVAVDDVSIDFVPGSVHAVVGENGAGKTTLMNLIYGVYQPDAGSIAVEGVRAVMRRPADAIRRGIALVHQHFELVPSFSVADNLMMIERRKVGLVPDRRAFAERAVAIARRYGLEIDPYAIVRDLPLGARQRVEILAGLLRDARLLILDEPTTVLPPPAIAGLFETLRHIANEGRSVVLITHKLAEVSEVADVFSVMRRGKLVHTGRASDTSAREVASLMVGRDVSTLDAPTPDEREPGEVALLVSQVSVPADEGSPGLSDVSFEVRAGEILAVVGVDGNGQAELIEVLAGLRRPTAGRVVLAGADITERSRREGARLGLAVIPEDRHAEGLVLPMTAEENMALDRIREPDFSRRGLWLRVSRIRVFVEGAIREFAIHGASARTPARTLSGGNQQKIVLARVLSSDPSVLIAAQPVRGLDVAATRYVLDQLVAARGRDRAVLLFSSDLEHVLALADRILVLFRGRIAASLDARSATLDDLGRYMAGVDAMPAVHHGEAVDD